VKKSTYRPGGCEARLADADRAFTSALVGIAMPLFTLADAAVVVSGFNRTGKTGV
jgi:hypothetical protein